MPRIVHVFTVPDSLVFLRGQVAFMRARGYDLTVVSSPGDALDAFGRQEGVAVHGLPMPRRISPGGDIKSLTRLVALLRRIRPEIVHAHTPKGGLIGTIAAKLAQVPVRIYHMRGLPLLTAHGAQRALLTATERTSCALATRVIAVSPSLRDVAIEHHLCSSRKIDVLASGSGNGVDCGRFDPDRFGPDHRDALRSALGVPVEAPVIGFIGRCVRDKGIVELVEAWRQIRTDHPTAVLVVAGVFEERDAIPALTRRALAEDPRVRLLGFVDDTPALFAALDVLALPTYREGFPNVPLEAAAMRVPVVTTRVPGCIDAVQDGVTGTLVPPRDAIALADALNVYLASKSLREQHGRAARLFVERSFRRERIWEALAALYDDLLAAPAARWRTAAPGPASHSTVRDPRC